MNKIGVAIIVWFCCTINSNSQTQTSIQGKIIDSKSQKILSGVSVKIKDAFYFAETDLNGVFKIENIPKGDYVVKLFFEGYQPQSIPVNIVETKAYDLGVIYLEETSMQGSCTCPLLSRMVFHLGRSHHCATVCTPLL